MVTYADHPWTKNYDPGVPATLEPYPDVSVQSFLQDAVKRLPIIQHSSAALTCRSLDV